MSDISEAQIRASFAKQLMMATFKAEILDLAHGTCRITAPILPLATQQHGFAHAGLSFALGDSADGYAAALVGLYERLSDDSAFARA